MEQTKKPHTTAAKIAITLVALIIAAVAGTLVQQLLFGKSNIAVTTAVIAVTAFSMWRQIWLNA
ncbi:MAG TPA: hypothetical protein PLD20_22230 [Blastocatellia bacterium]|nr:hypothetical protein [Blastocatellia bacterium]HMV87095.1 hypothetical protein [Blastocatellia bacterium]HMX27188.1 hypothetical protein [Blastocatellia bacterium]HMY76059.1 hypothetical protein [Blastocatellia bacterium]HMZ20671.1 hypothetical protein [Blastocatellia bacterium]